MIAKKEKPSKAKIERRFRCWGLNLNAFSWIHKCLFNLSWISQKCLSNLVIYLERYPDIQTKMNLRDPFFSDCKLA
jgi:hypothetical protein